MAHRGKQVGIWVGALSAAALLVLPAVAATRPEGKRPPAISLSFDRVGSFTPATATLQVGVNLNLTITSGAPAPAGGLLVTLTQTGSGSVTVVPSITIPATQTSASVVVAGANAGSVTLTATAVGRTPGIASFTVTPGQATITSFTPASGPVGTVVTITGTSFDPVAANNQVKFNGKPAIITSVNTTGTTLIVTVPQGATSGIISVTTPINTATSTGQFLVQSTQDFILSVAPTLPAVATVIQGGQVAYALTVSAAPGRSFAGLVALGTVGLPSGVTAQFSGPMLTNGQTGYVTVTVGGGVSPGTVSFNITGSAQLETGPVTQMVPASVQILASGGQTALSGQVLRTDGAPIPNVLMKIIGTSLEARTDGAGHFLLQNTPSGTQQLMVNANEAVAGYPIYHMDLVFPAGQVTVLPTIWITPPPPTERFTPINNAGGNQVITDSRYPGVEFTLPAGVTITGWDGNLKNKIAIERLSPDQLALQERLPFRQLHRSPHQSQLLCRPPQWLQ